MCERFYNVHFHQ